MWGGGGGKTPKCTDKINHVYTCTCDLGARASEASELLTNICFHVS